MLQVESASPCQPTTARQPSPANQVLRRQGQIPRGLQLTPKAYLPSNASTCVFLPISSHGRIVLWMDEVVVKELIKRRMLHKSVPFEHSYSRNLATTLPERISPLLFRKNPQQIELCPGLEDAAVRVPNLPSLLPCQDFVHWPRPDEQSPQWRTHLELVDGCLGDAQGKRAEPLTQLPRVFEVAC